MASKGLRAHEVHPLLVHAPLTLLPVAAGLDTLAAITGNRFAERAGCWAWFAGTSGGLAAGLAGSAASQEVKAAEHARDMMFVHGLGNLGIVLTAAGMALWRASHRANPASALLGLSACAAAVYTGWLGGELVYAHGVGVKGMGTIVAEGVADSPPLFSRRGGRKLVKDSIGGLRWLLTTLRRTAQGDYRVHAAALGLRRPPKILGRVIAPEIKPSPLPS